MQFASADFFNDANSTRHWEQQVLATSRAAFVSTRAVQQLATWWPLQVLKYLAALSSALPHSIGVRSSQRINSV